MQWMLTFAFVTKCHHSNRNMAGVVFSLVVYGCNCISD